MKQELPMELLQMANRNCLVKVVYIAIDVYEHDI